MLRPEMNFRVGYVNVQGLSRASWEACCTLLTTHFDYLFVAETWFVNHDFYRQDRRLIASTTPSSGNTHGRRHNGIYLLGSREARSQVERVSSTDYTITFVRNDQSFSGVYFPPRTLEIDSLTTLLNTITTSSIIIGDINTRFRLPCQSGEPGPPDRLEVFRDFLANTDHNHMSPVATHTQLTTDHCFVQRQLYSSMALNLLDNRHLKMDTDHKHTLSLTCRGQKASTELQEIQRFRIGRLRQPGMTVRINAWIGKAELPSRGQDIEAMNTALVRFCQRIQEETIGRVDTRSHRHPQEEPEPPRDSTLATSIRLYKHANIRSKENDVIFPTVEARARGMDAMTENLEILERRWSGPGFPSQHTGTLPQHVQYWTTEDVVTEIEQQEADKSCGADGIHIKFLKAVKESAVITSLGQLFNQCLRQGRTPRDWNQSEIHLLSKDPSQARDARNLRPISIICIFRKIFERLLLLRFQADAWAQFHPAQAGFRRSYSTYTNAAVVHSLLVSKARSAVVFLDFKSAFDVLDHRRLDAKLAARDCPVRVRRLIQSLMFTDQKSRLLINGQISDWFPRSCSVLQGSPLSPWLFNLFIDDLLYEVNAGISGVPICLFYADDGAIITNSQVDLAEKLKMVEEWSIRNGLLLNPAKCAVITTQIGLPTLSAYGQEIPRTDGYRYLGFPVTADGIDFPRHLEERMRAAVNRARWLGVQSNSWGPAHRLRVYKQFLAPMFEYGAPLVWAWASEDRQNHESFQRGCEGFKDLMAWISNTSDSRHLVTANLCGLSIVGERFRRLGTAYQFIIDQMSTDNPLKQALHQANSFSLLHSFPDRLRNNPGYARFKQTSNLEPTVRSALSRFLRKELHQTVQQEAATSHLTSLIPISSRKVPGLLLADISLSAPIPVQSVLLQYRRGVFMFNSVCACNTEVKFHRGHESCRALRSPLKLSRAQKHQKQEMQARLLLSGGIFTDIDYLLNSGRLKDATTVLFHIQRALRQIYKEVQIKEALT